MLKRVFTISAIMAVATLLLVVACGRRKPPPEKGGEGGGAKAAYVSKNDEGTISGKVSFEGTPAAPRKIDMSQDANCAGAPGDKNTDDVVVTDGKLANVFVYLKGGPVDRNSFPVPSDPVTLDQQGCRYHPRVLGIQT